MVAAHSGDAFSTIENMESAATYKSIVAVGFVVSPSVLRGTTAGAFGCIR